jgi:hypothetical protein
MGQSKTRNGKAVSLNQQVINNIYYIKKDNLYDAFCGYYSEWQ